MTFPNAYRGVKKLFNARILTIIALVLLIGGVLFFMISNKMITADGLNTAVLDELQANPTKSVEVMGPVAIPIVVGVILVLIAFIMQIVGLANAGKDEGAFRIAFWVIIAALIIGIVISVINNAKQVTGDSVETLAKSSILTTIISLVAAYVAELLTVKGVKNLAVKLDRADMLPKGNTLTVLIVIFAIISLVLNILPAVLGWAETPKALVYVSYVVDVLGIIVFFMMLSYLGKAKKMLEA